MKILVKVSGSISAYKICTVASQLKKLGHEIRVAASDSSLKFVGSTTWEGLSGNDVFQNDFEPGKRMDHIYLNDWADLVVLAPATAQTLNSLSSGVGSGTLTTLFLARKTETHYLIFPAMNPRMWASEIVQKSVDNLKSFKGVKVFTPSSGVMACGHEGVGRLWEPEKIINEILKFEPQKSKKVLITLGGTTEDIDGVRKITNFSSGKTGLAIARALKEKYSVVVLGSRTALKGEADLYQLDVHAYESMDDLSLKMKNLLSSSDYDLVIHAAAVSDFIPVNQYTEKISSDESLTVEFKKSPKILNSIKDWSKNKNCKLVSFKLTHNQSAKVIEEKIKKQFLNSETDFVIHNELENITFESHKYTIWKRNSEGHIFEGVNKSEMASNIIQLAGL